MCLMDDRFVRRTGKREFFETITSSLVHLEPAASFNPVDAWLAELSRRKELTDKQQEKNEKGKKQQKKKVDELREKNTAEQTAKRLHDEVVQIRNSKRNLLDVVGQIKLPQARAILLVQILATAYKQYEKNKDKRLLYEAYWALEGVELPTERAPKVQDEKVLLVKDSSLVYDNLANVEEIIQKAKKVISRDSDLIRVQLVEMSDSLPPLSRFSFGFRLDVWQMRVLTWIDAGKSVVISAPTSSGKTVLSSYVAVIFKTKAIQAGSEKKDEKAVGKTSALANNSDEDVEDNEPEEEDDYIAQLADHSGDGDVQFIKETRDYTPDLVAEDKRRRNDFLRLKKQLIKEESSVGGGGSTMRVLFVVPTEPLVWQVAAYFTKLLREQGDRKTPVAIVTDQLTYNPQHKLNIMPQIVVGTPFALESALTKPRGLTGMYETKNKASGNVIPGGFDHFDWVIYDEVHALDGAEGAALQRIIRSMNCRFLALSATVGNAHALRAWMEQVKSEQLGDVECLTVTVPDLEQVQQDEAQNASLDMAGLKIGEVPATVDKKSITIFKTSGGAQFKLDVSLDTTVQQLKDRICAEWPDLLAEDNIADHVRSPVQAFFKGVDLADNTKSLAFYGVFKTAGSTHDDIVYVPGRVHCLVHSTRFINLQRYLWDASKESKGTLLTVGPLAAVNSVEELQQGILHDSSLSFTSSDSYRVYEEAKKVYPAEAVAIISPYNFFGEKERITLQRVKDYEDLLKTGLQTLAKQYPEQTQTLLNAFAVKDGAKEVDLCELILQLKAVDMLPCLPFHLNTFEAIKLFQQVVAGLEYRQKKNNPTYYMDLQTQKEKLRSQRQAQIKATGGDAKKEEELERAGEIESAEGLSVDNLAPHPDYLLCKGAPLSDKELEDLVHEMESYDGFDKRDNMTGANRGKNQEILKHALVRGLRRGVGLFIEEVSFPSYRRAVQRLASQGKLGVVISDSSLAFGVNMPFRTTVFCGEMSGALDELMAQQMSGRAGRRGLDTQGNIVYAGLRAKVMRKLMIGTVAHIHGVDSRQVKYDTLFLQAVLSPRHTGYSRVQTIGRITLREFIENNQSSKDFAMQQSKQAMIDLGFVSFTNARDYRPNADLGMTDSLLTIIWEMREKVHESITIGMVFNRLLNEFHPIVRDLSLNERKSTVEQMDTHVFVFFSILIQLVARTPYEADEHGESVPILSLPFFSLPNHAEIYNRWEGIFAEQQASIPEEYAHLRDPVKPGVVLDGSLLQCILDRNYIHTLSDNKKQQLKQCMWHIGNVLKVFTNCSHTEDKYVRVACFIFRNAFNKLRYLNAELIRGIVQFDSVCDADKEKRIEKEQGCLAPMPPEAKIWTDLDTTPWEKAMLNAIAHFRDVLSAGSIPPQEIVHHIEVYADQFAALLPVDWEVIKLSATFNASDKSAEQRLRIVHALCKCSFATSYSSNVGKVHPSITSEMVPMLRLIGLMIWFCATVQPSQLSWFAAYLSVLHDEEQLSEECVLVWFNELQVDDLIPFSPIECGSADSSLNVELLTRLKKNCEPFIKWLTEEEEDDDEEEEEDA